MGRTDGIKVEKYDTERILAVEEAENRNVYHEVSEVILDVKMLMFYVEAQEMLFESLPDASKADDEWALLRLKRYLKDWLNSQAGLVKASVASALNLSHSVLAQHDELNDDAWVDHVQYPVLEQRDQALRDEWDDDAVSQHWQSSQLSEYDDRAHVCPPHQSVSEEPDCDVDVCVDEEFEDRAHLCPPPHAWVEHDRGE